jgi:hypothetical protein
MSKPLDDTGWQVPQIIATPTGGAGVITMPNTTEEKPCFTCKHWHKDTRKLVQFLKSRGLTPDAEGRYEVLTPDLPNRRSIKISLSYWGFCMTLAMPTHMDAGAQCPHWQATETRNDLAGKIR